VYGLFYKTLIDHGISEVIVCMGVVGFQMQSCGFYRKEDIRGFYGKIHQRVGSIKKGWVLSKGLVGTCAVCVDGVVQACFFLQCVSEIVVGIGEVGLELFSI
jgi:hypothetical protein